MSGHRRFCKRADAHSARIPSAAQVAGHVAEEKHAKRFYVSGRVQGVGFRFFAARIAGQLGVSGYVKNLNDGRVEVYAIGVLSQLQALHRELRRGPSHALVQSVDESDAEILPAWADDFSIED